MAARTGTWTWIGGQRQVFVKAVRRCDPYFAEVKPDGSWEVVSDPEGLRAEGGKCSDAKTAKTVATRSLKSWLETAERARMKKLAARIEVEKTYADDYPPPSIRRAM